MKTEIFWNLECVVLSNLSLPAPSTTTVAFTYSAVAEAPLPVIIVNHTFIGRIVYLTIYCIN